MKERLFPQHPLFWEMVDVFRTMVRKQHIDIQAARWYVLGYKWGWLDCEMKGMESKYRRK